MNFLKPKLEQPQQPKKIGFFRALWNFEKANFEKGKARYQKQQTVNRWDPSMNDSNPQTSETGESDCEEDLGMLNENDDGW